LICRNASEIWMSIEILYRLGRSCEFIGIKYLHKLLGLSWGFAEPPTSCRLSAGGRLSINKCHAKGMDCKLVVIIVMHDVWHATSMCPLWKIPY
jgi:hypothetical protein